ncbi:MAG TPA: zinc dependent phospholipase C family protein [Parasegetibacter sp.]|jgi:hypothetical protein
MKRPVLLAMLILLILTQANGWGFFAHKHINHHAVFLLPPEMLLFYKQHIQFITDHAVDPDSRRYVVKGEGPKHFIDMDRYGTYPYDSLPRTWAKAVEKFGEDSLAAHGIVPWWINVMLGRLTRAFEEKNQSAILKLSAEIGHYIGDAHVPLHACSNYNGQKTDQHGIHGFWESRIPELLALKEWDFFLTKATYVRSPMERIWEIILQSAASADTVLKKEAWLSKKFNPDTKYVYEVRNFQMVRQYSPAFSLAYNKALNGMIERRMQQSIVAVASFWYTAWVNAGQPSLEGMSEVKFTAEEIKEFEELSKVWIGSECY